MSDMNEPGVPGIEINAALRIAALGHAIAKDWVKSSVSGPSAVSLHALLGGLKYSSVMLSNKSINAMVAVSNFAVEGPASFSVFDSNSTLGDIALHKGSPIQGSLMGPAATVLLRCADVQQAVFTQPSTVYILCVPYDIAGTRFLPNGATGALLIGLDAETGLNATHLGILSLLAATIGARLSRSSAGILRSLNKITGFNVDMLCPIAEEGEEEEDNDNNDGDDQTSVSSSDRFSMDGQNNDNNNKNNSSDSITDMDVEAEEEEDPSPPSSSAGEKAPGSSSSSSSSVAALSDHESLETATMIEATETVITTVQVNNNSLVVDSEADEHPPCDARPSTDSAYRNNNNNSNTTTSDAAGNGHITTELGPPQSVDIQHSFAAVRVNKDTSDAALKSCFYSSAQTPFVEDEGQASGSNSGNASSSCSFSPTSSQSLPDKELVQLLYNNDKESTAVDSNSDDDVHELKRPPSPAASSSPPRSPITTTTNIQIAALPDVQITTTYGFVPSFQCKKVEQEFTTWMARRHTPIDLTFSILLFLSIMLGMLSYEGGQFLMVSQGEMLGIALCAGLALIPGAVITRSSAAYHALRERLLLSVRLYLVGIVAILAAKSCHLAAVHGSSMHWMSFIMMWSTECLAAASLGLRLRLKVHCAVQAIGTVLVAASLPAVCSSCMPVYQSNHHYSLLSAAIAGGMSRCIVNNLGLTVVLGCLVPTVILHAFEMRARKVFAHKLLLRNHHHHSTSAR